MYLPAHDFFPGEILENMNVRSIANVQNIKGRSGMAALGPCSISRHHPARPVLIKREAMFVSERKPPMLSPILARQ